MVRYLVTFASVSVIASQAVACGASPTKAGGRADSAAASKTPSVAVADTAFVEVRRYQQRGVRGPDGSCSWGAVPAVELPAGDPTQGFRVDRAVSVDREACVAVRAVGYRKVLPPDDTTGVGEVSASARIDLRGAGGSAPARRP
jgi:hypothetical protein